MAIGTGYTDRFLTQEEIHSIFEQGLSSIDVDGKKVLVIIPDSTRSGPIPLCFRLFVELLEDRTAQLDFMIALGTHMEMSDERINKHIGITAAERAGRYGGVGIYNHNWQEGLVEIGVIPASEISAITGGMMDEEVSVQINGRLSEYDHVIICGPVFPHEMVGYSGGNKYFFPGIAGPDVINLTHWLGALIGNVNIIGRENTPVRKVVDRAASFIGMPKSCFSMVVKGHEDLAGLYFGSPEDAQRAAAKIAAEVDVVYKDRAYDLVISVMPELYDDIWTAGKGMYKLEPVVADGGTLIIYAPHIDEVSYMHGKVLDRIGYHVRDYFLAHMDEYEGMPKGVMAHSTVVKGAGTYVDGVETPRVTVILATGVPKERCDRINLGYMDPATLDISQYEGREDEGILLVPRAGELLHRLASERE